MQLYRLGLYQCLNNAPLNIKIDWDYMLHSLNLDIVQVNKAAFFKPLYWYIHPFSPRKTPWCFNTFIFHHLKNSSILKSAFVGFLILLFWSNENSLTKHVSDTVFFIPCNTIKKRFFGRVAAAPPGQVVPKQAQGFGVAEGSRAPDSGVSVAGVALL